MTIVALVVAVAALAGCALLYRKVRKLSGQVEYLARWQGNVARQNPMFQDRWLEPIHLEPRKRK